MTLDQLFSRLSLGVLSNLSIGSEGQGMIPSQHHRRVAMMVDNALTQLYSRFNLLEREMVIRIYGSWTEYPFEKKYADTDPTVGPKFIEDSLANPFTEDVMKILEIFNEWGEEVVMNDPGDPTSLFTPNSRLLLVPTPVDGDCYHLLYQAYHPKLALSVPVQLSQPILAPAVLVPAIEHHVAYQVFSAINGMENASKAGEHLGRFEMICSEAETRDQATTSLVQTHSKLEDRGFV
ncbi:MAG: hypothetical protein ACT4OK_11070 [Gemmobacter sp.]